MGVQIVKSGTVTVLDAMRWVGREPDVSGDLVCDIAIIAGCTLLALLLGAATLRRRTP